MQGQPAVQVVDDAEVERLAAADPLATQSASIRAATAPVLAAGGALAVLQRLGRIDGWCISGPAADAAVLYRRLLADGHRAGSVPWAAYALLVDLAFAVVERWDFRWMAHRPEVPAPQAHWLPGADDAEVQRLLDDAFPTANIQTGHPAVRRWAGIRDDAGRLVACAADVTSAPTLGFIGSITTARDARGSGLGRAVTAWTCAALVAEHGRAALWLDHPNLAARATYDRVGLRDEHRMVWLSLDPED